MSPLPPTTGSPAPLAATDPPVVTVFDPYPVLSVTVEGHGDDPELHYHAAGQGVWVARMLASLGARPRLVCAVGGEAGLVLRAVLEREDVHPVAVETAVESASYVHDRRSGERLEVASTRPGALSRHELDDLYDAALVEGATSDAVVLAGPLPGSSFPADTYRRLAVDLRSVRVPVVADLSGDALAAALAGGVPMLKLSDEELADRYPPAVEEGADGGPADDRDWLADALGRLSADGAVDVVVSRGPRPTVARVLGELYEISSPRFATVDTRGGGDSMTAVLAIALARPAPWPDVLRLAGAAGSMNVTRRGLASARGQDVRRLAEACTVRRLEGARWDAVPAS